MSRVYSDKMVCHYSDHSERTQRICQRVESVVCYHSAVYISGQDMGVCKRKDVGQRTLWKSETKYQHW
jgi:hypothetical protein